MYVLCFCLSSARTTNNLSSLYLEHTLLELDHSATMSAGSDTDSNSSSVMEPSAPPYQPMIPDGAGHQSSSGPLAPPTEKAPSRKRPLGGRFAHKMENAKSMRQSRDQHAPALEVTPLYEHSLDGTERYARNLLQRTDVAESEPAHAEVRAS
ncbi:hypothetical protein NUW54_g14054 [Trametes sanguinea]|uniref:Uncharacterized protein n=1 Tax=Trametes sanguinea TaxID=158606 RepID=A0ACC1MGI1_9APHY|nr:hypothetical protein NUW54_g14054 [Trametes sanguinea]